MKSRVTKVIHPKHKEAGEIYFVEGVFDLLDLREVTNNETWLYKAITKSLTPRISQFPILVHSVKYISASDKEDHGYYAVQIVDKTRTQVSTVILDLANYNEKPSKSASVDHVDKDDLLDSKTKQNLHVIIEDAPFLPNRFNPLSEANENFFKNILEPFNTQAKQQKAQQDDDFS